MGDCCNPRRIHIGSTWSKLHCCCTRHCPYTYQTLCLHRRPNGRQVHITDVRSGICAGLKAPIFIALVVVSLQCTGVFAGAVAASPPRLAASPPRRLAASLSVIQHHLFGSFLHRLACCWRVLRAASFVPRRLSRYFCTDIGSAARSLLNSALTAAPRPLTSLAAMSGNVLANRTLLQLLTPHIRLIYPNASQQCAVRSC